MPNSDTTHHLVAKHVLRVCEIRLTRREEVRKRLRERRRRRFWLPDAKPWTSTTWTKTNWSTPAFLKRAKRVNGNDDVRCVSCRDKINELYEWMCQLESEKFDHMEKLKLQKYEVRTWPWLLHTRALSSVDFSVFDSSSRSRDCVRESRSSVNCK